VRIVLLGPPGAGKGTQAQIIANELNVPAISTGDIFRANVSGQTELGRQAKAYMDAGDLVPDEITVAMVKDRLAEPDAKAGFLLDGFPRTIAQAEQLRESLAEMGQGLDAVLELGVDEDELVRRLSGRRMLVDGQWVQRDDDKPETVRHRLGVYREQTAPLSGFYEREGLLRRIDAMGPIETVTERAMKGLRDGEGSDREGSDGAGSDRPGAG
jgi:adenylate kinase